MENDILLVNQMKPISAQVWSSWDGGEQGFSEAFIGSTSWVAISQLTAAQSNDDVQSI